MFVPTVRVVRLPLVMGMNTYAGILTPSTNVPFADKKSTIKAFNPMGILKKIKIIGQNN